MQAKPIIEIAPPVFDEKFHEKISNFVNCKAVSKSRHVGAMRAKKRKPGTFRYRACLAAFRHSESSRAHRVDMSTLAARDNC